MTIRHCILAVRNGLKMKSYPLFHACYMMNYFFAVCKYEIKTYEHLYNTLKSEFVSDFSQNLHFYLYNSTTLLAQ